MEALLRFYSNPARAFLRGLRVILKDDVEALEDREPVQLDALKCYELGTRALRVLSTGGQLVTDLELKRGDYPSGAPGKVQRDEILRLTGEVVRQARLYMTQPPQPRRDLRADLDLIHSRRVEVRGCIDGLFGARRVVCSYGKFRVKRYLALWVEHLLCSVALEGFHESILIAPDDKGGVVVKRLQRLPTLAALDELRALVQFYYDGQLRPLCFHPEASWEVCTRLAQEQLRVGRQTEPDIGVSPILVSRLRATLRERAEAQLLFRGQLEANFLQVFGAEDPLGFERDAQLALEDVHFVKLSQTILGRLMERDGETS